MIYFKVWSSTFGLRLCGCFWYQKKERKAIFFLLPTKSVKAKACSRGKIMWLVMVSKGSYSYDKQYCPTFWDQNVFTILHIFLYGLDRCCYTIKLLNDSERERLAFCGCQRHWIHALREVAPSETFRYEIILYGFFT